MENRKLPQNRPKRLAAVILSGLLGGVVLITGFLLLLNPQTQKRIPIAQALWVTDWEIQHLYGPGTTRQQKIVDLLGSHLEFEAPVLYRMGGSGSHDPSEGLLIYGFDLKRPEMAKALAAKQQ